MCTKVILIGLDGVDLDLLQPWIEAGELPNFEELISKGATAKLRTCPPCWTIPNWNSIATGKTPGTLGVYDFMHHDQSDRQLRPYFTARGDGTPLWRYIELEGGKSCIGNLPSLHTPTKMKGASVTGWLPEDEERLTYPPSLQNELDELVDGYELDIKSIDIKKGDVSSDWEGKQDFLKSLHALTEDRMDVFDYLFELDDWDFFMPVFTGTDRINHALWGEEEALIRYYSRIDEWIGTVLCRADDDSIVGLVSDHGFTGHKKTFYINEMLENLGFLSRGDTGSKATASLASKLVNYGRSNFPETVKTLIPDKIRHSLANAAETSFDEADIDWENTLAYCTSVSGTIFIDTNGRQEHRETVAESLENALRSQGLSPETFRIYRTSDVYPTREANPPELILEFDDVDINTGFRENGDSYLISKPMYGNHQRTGLFTLYGPGIRSGVHESASVIDIAPTILFLLNAPIPTDMDGEILFDLMNTDEGEVSKEELQREPLSLEKSTAATDGSAIEDRLESLGYL